jgi:hypothetical protein
MDIFYNYIKNYEEEGAIKQDVYDQDFSDFDI